MEFGEHCCFAECKKLDFLPIKCSACKQNFCSSHYLFNQHNCSKATYSDKNAENSFQIPVCPICLKNVSFLDSNRNPDDAINNHIELGCKQNPRKKIYTNSCNFKHCKKKELIPIRCSNCEITFCLRHRLAEDHECIGKKQALINARLKKFSKPKTVNKSSNISKKPSTSNSSTKITNNNNNTKAQQEKVDHELAIQLQNTWNESANINNQGSSGQNHQNRNQNSSNQSNGNQNSQIYNDKGCTIC